MTERALADLAVAEACAAGALGVEERSGGDRIALLVYLEAAAEDDVREALERALGRRGELGAGETVDDVDWSHAWRDGLEAVVVSERLVVRPSFREVEELAGRRELVIDPGQAFGTGGHASTRLALEAIDALAGGFSTETRVLDLGTGTGVLALAALALGAGHAVGLDIDRLAAVEARVWAVRNGLADDFDVIAGPLAALAAPPFDLVVANLLRRELMPEVDALAASVRPGGSLVVSGLLVSEGARVAEAFVERGMAPCDERSHTDANGDAWTALRLERT